MDVNGQNGKPMLNGASNGAVHHITDHYHEKSFATNIQTSLGSNPGGKEELINNFQMKIGQDMDFGMKSTQSKASSMQFLKSTDEFQILFKHFFNQSEQVLLIYLLSFFHLNNLID